MWKAHCTGCPSPTPLCDLILTLRDPKFDHDKQLHPGSVPAHSLLMGIQNALLAKVWTPPHPQVHFRVACQWILASTQKYAEMEQRIAFMDSPLQMSIAGWRILTQRRQRTVSVWHEDQPDRHLRWLSSRFSSMLVQSDTVSGCCLACHPHHSNPCMLRTSYLNRRLTIVGMTRLSFYVSSCLFDVKCCWFQGLAHSSIF